MSEARKVEFWWASVAGADCEPVKVTTLGAERVAYRCGYADPFYLDRPDCPAVLVVEDWKWVMVEGEEAQREPVPMDVPPTPTQKAAREFAGGRSYSWRRPR